MLKGERKPQGAGEEISYHRRNGQPTFQENLPGKVDAENVSATYKDGHLSSLCKGKAVYRRSLCKPNDDCYYEQKQTYMADIELEARPSREKPRRGAHSRRCMEPAVDIYDTPLRAGILADMPESNGGREIDLKDDILTIMEKPDVSDQGADPAEHAGNYFRTFRLTGHRPEQNNCCHV
jgi:HSP20 family molecular chaperone IbpA